MYRCLPFLLGIQILLTNCMDFFILCTGFDIDAANVVCIVGIPAAGAMKYLPIAVCFVKTATHETGLAGICRFNLHKRKSMPGKLFHQFLCKFSSGKDREHPIHLTAFVVLIPSRFPCEDCCRTKPGVAYLLAVGDTVFSPPTTAARLTLQFISLPAFHLEGRRILVFLIKLSSFQNRYLIYIIF